jgi:diguanylate cyclase (GGDEF)-like protein
MMIESDPIESELIRDLLVEESIHTYEYCNSGEFDYGMPGDQSAIDVVLVDAVSTEAGRETFYRIQQERPEVPVIVLLEQENEFLADEFLSSGAQDYLVKGQLDRTILEKTISHALERNRLTLELSEARKTERYLAYHDPLTSLPNRHLFYDRLRQAISQAKRLSRMAVLLILDLDGFKKINDTLGHGIGDELLKAVARRLRKRVREVDTIGRLGGDEFTVVLTEISHLKDALRIANDILSNLSRPFSIEGHEFFITASIGISIYPDDGDEIEGLLRKADIAMGRAKAYGKNTLQIYNLSMDAKFAEHLQLDNSLRRAIANEELTVHYQPQVDLASNRIVGVEALVRWQHPQHGIVAPDRFIPLAEENGLIVAIDEWVMRQAAHQIARWHNLGYTGLRLSVNVSARHFRVKSLERMIERILLETNLEPGLLCVEITESHVMHNVEHAVATLNRLKQMGIKLSIDDFGTGYSSLNYLKSFPFDILKIDRSFVRGIPADRHDTAISTALVVLARSMELIVVAEGVETEEQRDFFRALECHEMQGYLFSKPLSSDGIEQLLQQG